jgi:hypothetical protein
MIDNNSKGQNNSGGTPGLSAVPSADPKPQVTPVKKEEVIEYTFKPSGQDMVTDKLVYNKVKGPAWYSRIFNGLITILLFPIKLIYRLLEIILKALNLVQTTCLTIAFIIIILVLGLVIVVLYKPEFLWNPIKTYLNADMVVNEVDTISLDSLYERINTEVAANGQVTINNSELTVLIRDFTLLDKKLRVKSHQDGMLFYINIDSEQRPLWFRVETIKLNNKMVVDKVGFGRFNTPNDLAGFLNDTVGIVFSVIEQQVTAKNYVTFFDQILNKSKLQPGLTLNSVEMQQDQVSLYFTVLTETD